MPRPGRGRRKDKKRRQGHKMHRRNRAARLLARMGKGREGRAWGRGGDV